MPPELEKKVLTSMLGGEHLFYNLKNKVKRYLGEQRTAIYDGADNRHSSPMIECFLIQDCYSFSLGVF